MVAHHLSTSAKQTSAFVNQVISSTKLLEATEPCLGSPLGNKHQGKRRLLRGASRLSCSTTADIKTIAKTSSAVRYQYGTGGVTGTMAPIPRHRAALIIFVALGTLALLPSHVSAAGNIGKFVIIFSQAM